MALPQGPLSFRKTRRMTYYDELLFSLVRFSFLTRSVLCCMAADPNTTRSNISRAQMQNHIKAYRSTILVNGNKRSLKYYGITSDGLRFLKSRADYLPEGMQWLKYLHDEDIDRMTLAGRNVGSDRLERFLKITGAAFMSYTAGADSQPLYLSDRIFADTISNLSGDSGIMTSDRIDIAELARGAEERWCTEQSLNGILSPASSDLFFTDAITLKSRIIKSTDQRNEYRGGRFTGILESPLRTVITYAGDNRGMSWTRTATKTELAATRVYKARLRHYEAIPSQKPENMVIVKNAAQFTSLYLNERQKGNGEPFASGYAACYIVPVSRNGIEQMRDIMLNETDAYEKQLAASAVDSGLFCNNTGNDRDLFPLTSNRTGMHVMLGTFMDAVKLRRAAAVSEKRNNGFGVICKPWQADYYARVIPGITTFVMYES